MRIALREIDFLLTICDWFLSCFTCWELSHLWSYFTLPWLLTLSCVIFLKENS